MTKYQEYFQKMLEENKELFEKFAPVHDGFVADATKWQGEFNKMGSEVIDVIRDYESRLCNQSEASQYGKFSSKLSDKFWDLVRKKLLQFDYVGVKISKA